MQGDAAVPDVTALCLATQSPVVPETLWLAWSFAPATLIPLLVLVAVPLRAGNAAALDRREKAAWFFGWALLVVALVSPLCRLAATLAWAHMLQHFILIVLAPAPMALALASIVRRHSRLSAASAIVSVSAATLLLGATIWLAHAPPIYQAALFGGAAHLALLALVLGAALLFWTKVWMTDRLKAPAMIFLTMAHTGLLGALLTFSPSLWYPVHGVGPALWGLTALEDQQLAGLIMWAPMSAVLLVIGLIVGGRHLLRSS